LQVKEPARTLQIGERVGIGGDQAFEFRPRGDLKSQRVQKLDVVPLEDVT
jgi:hypothetical protein